MKLEYSSRGSLSKLGRLLVNWREHNFRRSLRALVNAVDNAGSQVPLTPTRELTRLEFAGRLGALALTAAFLYLAPAPFRRSRLYSRKNAAPSVAAGDAPRETYATPVDFFTDFTEHDPMQYWQRWGGRDLIIEPFGSLMSALPSDPCVVARTIGMKDGRVSFYFSVERPAEFVFRGRSLADCYVARVELIGGRDPHLQLSVIRRKQGAKDETIATAKFRNKDYVNRIAHRLTIKMDGNFFAASLQREVGKPDFFPFLWQELEERQFHTWRDEVHRQGHVGLFARSPEAKTAPRPFRVFSVRVES